MNKPGWRQFACDDCGQIWWETTRDRFSMSGETCSNCGEWVRPCDEKEGDTPVLVNDMGNLLKYETVVEQTGLPIGRNI